MKKKVAVIAANGCEEGETLTIVDILRRGLFACDIVGLEKKSQDNKELFLKLINYWMNIF